MCVAEQRKVEGVALADSAASSHVSNRTTSRDTSRKSFASAAVDAGRELSSSSSSGSFGLGGWSRNWPLASLLATRRRFSAAVAPMVVTAALCVTSVVT